MNNWRIFVFMKVIRNLLDVLIDGSILVGASVAALQIITLDNLDIGVHENLIYFSFFGSIFAYNFIKYLNEFKATRGKFESGNLQLILVITVITGLMSGFYFVELSDSVKMLTLIPLGLTVFYTIPIFKNTLRTLSGLKIYVISFCWAFVTVLLLAIDWEVFFDSNVWVTFAQRFIFIFALMIPFELRDMDSDDMNLKTIPQRFGIKKSKVIGVFACVLFLLLEIFKDSAIRDFFEIGFVFLVTSLLIILTPKKQPKYYASILVESIPIFWFMLFVYFF